MKKQSSLAVFVFALSAATSGVCFSQGQHATISINGIATSSYTATLGVIKTAQITYPNVYMNPAFNEAWFSTVRTCNTVGNLFAGDNALPLTFNVYDNNGQIVRTIPDVILEPNKCVSYTSDVANDPMFHDLPPGVYQVTATVIAPTATDLVAILVAGGNLNGSVNSTARNYIKPTH